MAYRYRILPAAGRVSVRGFGRTELIDCKNALTRIAQDARFRPHFDILADVRDVWSQPSFGDLLDLARFIAALDSFHGRLAVVVGRPVQYGLTRMIQVPLGLRGYTVKPFWSVEAATDWLAQGKEAEAPEAELGWG